ncbi:hypothetical protein [Enterovibrio norvegicus]|uniref:hypothetical protein n=1 Tax=Enterovibrio norvegicus TaxID=188144 RepID=UPI001E64FE0B|nr:hypothetical protein [Enterovibrio norvegicus]MCC4796454.1 hypothetical protein [Enterovibrio norvegicus]
MIKIKKILNIALFFLLSVFVALAILFFGFFEIVTLPTSSAQMLGEMLWLSEPDFVGFKIIESAHPDYNVKIMMGSPDQLHYEGMFTYTGSELDEVELTDIYSYLGKEIGLTNGEKLVPAQ